MIQYFLNINLPLFVKKKIAYIKFIFFASFFLGSCSSSLPLAEKIKNACEGEKIEAFLNELLFQEGGCYTLFGDKPMTSLLVYSGKSEDFSIEYLSKESADKVIFIDDKTAENFDAWNAFSKELHFQNFFLVRFPHSEDPTCNFVFFVNIKETKKFFSKYRDSFHQRIGNLDWEKVLFELKKPNVEIWNSLIKDHYLTGILYGFGQENCKAFCNTDSKRVFSEQFEGAATKSDFPIPIFAISKNDSTVQKYRKQREKIKEIYKDKTILEVTLKALLE